MPVAFAQGGDPEATKSASLKKQIKSLKKRVAALEAKPDQVGQVPTSLPPSGPAGGDLTGSYPNPVIAPDALPTSLPPSGPAGGGLTSNYPNPLIAANAVGGNQIAADAVDSSEIAAAAVRGSELLDYQVRNGAEVNVTDGTALNGDWIQVTANAACTAGEQLVGGYAEWTSNGDENATQEIIPDFGANSVTARGITDNGSTETFRASAVCISD